VLALVAAENPPPHAATSIFVFSAVTPTNLRLDGASIGAVKVINTQARFRGGGSGPEALCLLVGVAGFEPTASSSRSTTEAGI
jgi:hypothetical protein